MNTITRLKNVISVKFNPKRIFLLILLGLIVFLIGIALNISIIGFFGIIIMSFGALMMPCYMGNGEIK